MLTCVSTFPEAVASRKCELRKSLPGFFRL